MRAAVARNRLWPGRLQHVLEQDLRRLAATACVWQRRCGR